MKIYTRTGDKGTTSLVDGSRTPKSDIRLDAYGTIDELNSWLGFILSIGVEKQAASFIVHVQNRLFDVGCLLASPAGAKCFIPEALVAIPRSTEAVEKEIDRLTAAIPQNNRFVLPGGTQAASATHIARTVCRRAERIMSSIQPGVSQAWEDCLKFVNRLSDYLFVLARYLNHTAGVSENFWEP